MQTMINKISTAKVVGKVEKPTARKLLYTVGGIAKGFRVGESQYGDYVEFKGNFRAIVSGDDGETVYASGKCFLPEMASNMIHMALQEPENDEVQFAFEIGVAPSNNAIGYEYFCNPIIEPTETDAMGDLMSKIASHVGPALGDETKGKKKAG